MATKRTTKKLPTGKKIRQSNPKDTTLNFASSKSGFNLVGNSLNDTLIGGKAANSIVGGNGNNYLVGGAGNDTINSGSGNDSIFGNGGADRINAGAGNDTIVFSTAANLAAAATVIGGTDTNTISITGDSQSIADSQFSKVTQVQILNLGNGTNSVTLGAAATAAGIQSVTGGTGNDTFTQATTTSFTIDGKGGSDSLTLSTAGTVSDYTKLSNIEKLNLADGANTVNLATAGAAGIASVDGGSGADAFTAAATTSFTIDGKGGTDSLTLSIAGTVSDYSKLSNIEKLNLADGANTVNLATAGAAGIVSVDGGSGADAFTAAATTSFTIDGKGGTDSLTLSIAGTVSDYSKLSNIEKLNLANGGNTVDFGSNAATAGIATMTGGAGNDTFIHTAGSATTLIGGDGNDEFRFATKAIFAADSIDGGIGVNEVEITGNGETIIDADLSRISAGTIRSIEISGTGSTVALASFANAVGIQSLFGGAGGDTFTSNVVGVYIDAKNGANSITVNNTDNSLIGGTGNDTFTINNVGAYVDAGSGNNLITFNTAQQMKSATAVVGTTGDDTISFNTAVTLVDTDFVNVALGAGNNWLNLAGSGNSVVLGAIAQTAASISTVVGGTGNSTVDSSASSGSMTLNGGASGGSSLVGGSAADSIVGGSGADTILGNAGADIIIGNGGADSILAGNDNDTIRFASQAALDAAATVAGGTGDDTLAITGSGVLLTNPDFTDVHSVEALAFTNNGNNSAILGTEAQSAGLVSLYGGTGNDTFDASNAAYNATGVYYQGNGGADSLIGGGANDTFVFSTAALLNLAATVAGGTGVDTISITTAGETVADADFTDVDSVAALVVADGGNATVTINTEALAGGIVSLFGGNGDDTFDTGAAYDGTQAVTLIGGAGADSLLGRDQADSIVGGAGNDVINGRGGADNLDGGADNDTFVFSTAALLNLAATVAGGTGVDTISITTAGETVADADFTDVDSVAALVVADGAGANVTIGTEALAGGIVSLFGGTGADTFDASNAAYNTTGVYFQGNGGADSLIGGGSTDKFVFATAAALNLAATVAGGSGNDTISLTTHNQAVVDADFTDVLSVQALTFADGTGSSAVLAALANTAGIASVYGGSGNDTLTVDETIYTGPTFEGADGTDVLVLSNNAATVTDSFFTNVLSVASFQTANGANDITLGAQATEAGIATVTGGTGNDILNAVAMTSVVTLMGGLGEDTLTGGSGGSRQQGWSGTASANTFRDTLTGGSGADSFVLGNAVSNAYGFDSNPATNYRALINGFDTGATDDVLVLNALGQSGALTVEASTTIANRMDIKMGGLLVYRFNYDNAGQTAALYVGDSTNVVAEFNNFTSGGQNLSTSNFQILG